MEQDKAQEATLKRAIEDSAASDARKEKDESRKALVKAGEIPMLIPSPTAAEAQGPRKAAKTIKAPILLCVFNSALMARDSLVDMKHTGSSDHRGRERRR